MFDDVQKLLLSYYDSDFLNNEHGQTLAPCLLQSGFSDCYGVLLPAVQQTFNTSLAGL